MLYPPFLTERFRINSLVSALSLFPEILEVCPIHAPSTHPFYKFTEFCPFSLKAVEGKSGSGYPSAMPTITRLSSGMDKISFKISGCPTATAMMQVPRPGHGRAGRSSGDKTDIQHGVLNKLSLGMQATIRQGTSKKKGHVQRIFIAGILIFPFYGKRLQHAFPTSMYLFFMPRPDSRHRYICEKASPSLISGGLPF